MWLVGVESVKAPIRIGYSMAKPKIAFFDIETTNLNANFGYVIAVCWKFRGNKKIHTVKITDSPTFKKDPTNDKWVVQTAAEGLSKADMWVGWYSTRFDEPYLNSRLLYHDLGPMPPVPHVDGWKIARYKMKLNSNRLQTVTSFLGMEDKTPLSGPIWIRAMAGQKDAINYVVKHCQQDVVVLEQVFEKIKILSTSLPNINVVTGKTDSCPSCGTQGNLQKRGFRIAKVSKTQRYYCTSCGAWSHGRPQRVPFIEVR